MTYTLHLATPETRDLVVEALRSAASQRTRVAQRAAVEVAADKAARQDVRTRSVRLVELLAAAGQLEALADELETAQAVPVLAERAPWDVFDVARAEHEVRLDGLEDPTPLDVAAGGDGTGLSAEAQHVAELAGLKPYDPDAPEAPDTGAIPEDVPAPDDVADVALDAPQETP